jgi:hypothetical protein
MWEGMGRKVPAGLAGGVLIVEASKQLEAPRRPGSPVTVRRPLRVLDGITQPGAEPA